MNTAQKQARAKQVAQMRADADTLARRADQQMRREAMIQNVADTVSTDWYRRAVRNPVAMSLYWRKPREGENAACPIIDFTAPNDDFVKHCDISPAMSKTRVFSIVADAMRTLPMLAPSWFSAV